MDYSSYFQGRACRAFPTKEIFHKKKKMKKGETVYNKDLLFMETYLSGCEKVLALKRRAQFSY